MNKRKEALLKRMPTFLFFEEEFKKDGKNIMGRKVNLSAPPEPGNLLNCSPLLNKEQERILFRRFNYLKYRALSTVAGTKWKSAMEDERFMRARISSLGSAKLRAAENFVSGAEEVRNILMNSNARLAVKPVFYYERADTIRHEELISNSCVHIMKAVEKFDYRKGFKFSTYCVNAIQNNLRREVHNETMNRIRFGGEEDPKSPAVSHDLPDTRSYDHDFALKAVAMLGPTERKVIEGLFGINRDKAMIRDMVGELGVSKETVRKIRMRAMAAISLMPYDPPA